MLGHMSDQTWHKKLSSVFQTEMFCLVACLVEKLYNVYNILCIQNLDNSGVLHYHCKVMLGIWRKVLSLVYHQHDYLLPVSLNSSYYINVFLCQEISVGGPIKGLGRGYPCSSKHPIRNPPSYTSYHFSIPTDNEKVQLWKFMIQVY